MAQEGVYSAHLKCCTYTPFLSNFILGEIIVGRPKWYSHYSKSAEERRRFLPIGFFPDPEYRSKHKYMPSTDFGRREDLICPFLDTNLHCSIWQERNSACSSFHCKSSYGNLGMKFWRSYYEFFNYLEMNFAQLAMLEMGFDWEEVLDNLYWYEVQRVEEPNPYLNDSNYKRAWAHWNKKQKLYFAKCWQWFNNLDKQEFWKLLDEQGMTYFESLSRDLGCVISSSCQKLPKDNKRSLPSLNP